MGRRMGARSVAVVVSLLAFGSPVRGQDVDLSDGLLVRDAVEAPGARARPLLQAMAEGNVPGMAIALVRHNRVVWEGGFGHGSPGGSPVDRATAFQIASLSKAVTGVLVAALLESSPSTLPLSRDVNELLEGWTLLRADGTAASGVTAELLLRHSGGTNVPGFPGHPARVQLPALHDVLDGRSPDGTPRVVVERPPGEIPIYSGGGYLLIQYLLEQRTGRTFGELLHEEISGPLQLTTVSADGPEGVHALGHDREGRTIPDGFRRFAEDAPAGIWSSAGDVARILSAVALGAAGLESPLPGGVAHEMLRTVPTRVPGPGFEWGPGWEIRKEAGVRFVSMTGSNPGYRARLVLFPDTGDGAVVLTNSDAGGPLIDAVLRGMAVRMGWPALGPRVVATAAPSGDGDGDLVGRYRFGPGTLVFEIRQSGQGLELKLPWGPFSPLQRVDADVWITEDGSDVRVERGAGGAIEAVVVTPPGQDPLRGLGG